jgi:hypothetical protein
MLDATASKTKIKHGGLRKRVAIDTKMKQNLQIS